ncbi:MAG: bifunctional (p)ppGpp synthetase/guanosine-3',5'-bis(diphosphate) 3'-pyrophosphohydrolase [Desulfobacterales bacterium]|nr:bifunctional (p)ppGpp synthetase/guanosine-3',5'-bis(diphosphate) 3'-pyrophosphohydrolase [Desulfobacterales bacterium]
MIRINDILDKMVEHNPDANLDVVDRAYIYSARVHAGQVRLSGEPYLSHPLEVAGLLADMKLDGVSVASGLLHDVIEDTRATSEEIGEIFGKEVAHIVSGVTKLSKLQFKSSRAREAESIRKMILAMADDIRVILIKLADRLHNMRTLQFHKEHKRMKIAQETLDIYAPLADRLGIYWIKQELENISFKYLQPEEYERIKNLINKDKEDRDKYVETVKEYIKEKMEANSLKCEVMGRYKQYYSTYYKMVTQSLEFEDLYDIIAFRIILDTKSQCYEALGLLHTMWKPIPKKFKDYIGVPKPNMYQSLHTTVVGPFGERMEIQIRTNEMDKVAKSGIAAHWSYKEGKMFDEKVGKTFSWLQDLLETHRDYHDPVEFLENVRIDLFPDEVYVFTPRGEIRSLPKGATPVDFAYQIHTEVGNQCTGAKVNGRLVPLQYELKTGDAVEIVTTKGHNPSKDWLNFVKTVKARSRIRQWIKAQEKERSLSLGKEMCEKAFRKYRLNFTAMLRSEEINIAVTSFNYKTVDDLIASVGYGKITPLQIIKKVAPIRETEDEDSSILNRIIGKVRKKKVNEGVVVKGVDDILIKFGKCCQPVPGDSIVGYITRGHGVAIHRSNCVNSLKMSPERQIEVEWNEDMKERYPLKIRIRAYDRFGLLADITGTISKSEANIINAKTHTNDDKTVDSYFSIEVEDTAHLKRVLTAIKKIKHVHEVKRIDN